MLDTERVALQALFDMIRRFKVGYRVELHKRTLERALLSLIGPRAAAAAGAEGLARRGARERAACRSTASQALAVRTDLGVDLLCEAAERERLCEALLRARGAARSTRRRPSACASKAGAPATGSTSTTP